MRAVLCPVAEEGEPIGEEEPLTGKDEEERRIAEMGRPMLGDHPKLEVIIEESYEFKVLHGVNALKTLFMSPHFLRKSIRLDLSGG